MKVENFRAASAAELPPPARPKGKATRAAQTRPFLRGPVPMDWLARAHRVGGSALAVGLVLWFVRGVSGKAAPVRIDSALRRRGGLTPDEARRGIPALESAGLARVVVGGRGRCPVVEILDQPPQTIGGQP
jgi:hypothetical protein